jgi:hypothetical protein
MKVLFPFKCLPFLTEECVSRFFLVVWRGDIHHVLLGKINKDYDWLRIGALDKERVLKEQATDSPFFD